MKVIFGRIQFLSIFLLLLTFQISCDEDEGDIPPAAFQEFQLNDDNVFMFNGGNPEGVRLDPLVNDSIKVDLNISYSNPRNGAIRFVENEGWFYTPNAEFYGIDSITYKGCFQQVCKTALIRMYVERPFDPDDCEFELNAESVETSMDKPLEIMIFGNDIICRYYGMSLFSPEKGTFNTYSYSGSYKSIIYVYYPPQGFKGTDRFKYRIFTETGYLETYCEITVK